MERSGRTIASELRAQRSTVVGALGILLCLSCSIASEVIVANASERPITLQAHFAHYLMVGDRIPPIELADLRTIGHGDAWRAAPALAVDTVYRIVRLTLPPGTAARLGYARNCIRPETCDGYPIVWLDLTGSGDSVRMEGARLQEAFVRDARYRFVLWYPLIGAHDFWKHLRLARAAMLCLAIAISLFTLWVAVTVVRTPMRRRWGWAVVALLGVGKVVVNWTSGETIAHLVSFPSITAPIARSELLGPWVVAVSFPLGAILALWRRQRALGGLPPSE
jgi:hypothetical protein